MKHASYRDAIRWLADNDDNEWLDRHDMDGMLTPSVAACLVADIFGVESDKMITDLRRALEPVEPKPIRHKTSGKAMGGYARAASLTPSQRQEIARKAAKTRWDKIAPTLMDALNKAKADARARAKAPK